MLDEIKDGNSVPHGGEEMCSLGVEEKVALVVNCSKQVGELHQC